MDERAINPNFKFGRGIIRDASREWGDYLLVTMPEVWKKSEKMLLKKPRQIFFVKTMELIEIEKAEKELPGAETIVGMGGGMAIDFAKFVSWKRGMEPVLVPGVVSVDAPVCQSIAVREQNRVRYIGKALAREIIVDFDLIQSAPVRLNRAGIGDILSIHTALFDWSLAGKLGKTEYNEALARDAGKILDELEEHCSEIGNASEKGLTWLMRAFARENALCIKNGNSRPEEGSEHFFAYNLEYLTGRGYIHGELVCLGVLLMARLQENVVKRVEKILSQTGVNYHPKDLGISREEINKALITLKDYTEKEKLGYSIINNKPITGKVIEEICQGLDYGSS